MLYVGCRLFIDILRDDLPRNLPLGLASTQWVGGCAFFTLLCFDLYLAFRARKSYSADARGPGHSGKVVVRK